MNINDIQKCAQYYKDNYLETFYIITTFSGNSFILVSEKKNFPHLMGIKKRVYQSNGYNKGSKLYEDILNGVSISPKIIPHNIVKNSKMYNKALNFNNSTNIFWRNSGPLAINYNSSLSSTKLNNVDMLLVDIISGYMTGWVDNNQVNLSADLSFKKYCFVSWIDESSSTSPNPEKYMPNQDIDLIKTVLAFTKSSAVKQKAYSYDKSQKISILKSIEKHNSNLIIDKRNEHYYKSIAQSQNIHCKINGVQY